MLMTSMGDEGATVPPVETRHLVFRILQFLVTLVYYIARYPVPLAYPRTVAVRAIRFPALPPAASFGCLAFPRAFGHLSCIRVVPALQGASSGVQGELA